MPVSGCVMVHIRPWNGPYHVPIWCLLQDERIIFKHKPLTINKLHKPLIFREFASEGASARKYSLIFRGRTENPDGKNTSYWKSVSAPMDLSRKKDATVLRRWERSHCVEILYTEFLQNRGFPYSTKQVYRQETGRNATYSHKTAMCGMAM